MRHPSTRLSGLAPAIALLLILAVSLAACGKKGSPEAAEGEKVTYPRSYPTR